MNNRKKLLLACILSWTLLAVLSLLYSYNTLTKERDTLALTSAKDYAELITITRMWNSAQKGVHVKISDSVQPNPYLPKDRQITTTSTGQNLALINPAYMTRQISEFASQRKGIQFHMTSLNPLNPVNKANAFEKEALQAIKDNPTSVDDFFRVQDSTFQYISPLFIEQPCLECHGHQGYTKGDLAGGISVTTPYDDNIPILPIAFIHLLIFSSGILFMLYSYTKLQSAYETIEYQATMDDTTGIANRRSFFHMYRLQYKQNYLSNSSMAVIMSDIDHFKAYNDYYGHVEGDNCLHSVAQTIASSPSRPLDFVARYGGEEFIILLPNTDEDGAVKIAEKIREKVEGKKIEHKKSATAEVVTLSLGIATYDSTKAKISSEQLLLQADLALYKAKNSGRNRVVLYQDDQNEKSSGIKETT